MHGDSMILLLVLLPLIGSFLCLICGAGVPEEAHRHPRKTARDAMFVIITGLTFVLAVLLAVQAFSGEQPSLRVEEICAKGMSFTVDGFRGIYIVLATLAWFMTSLFSMDYMKHGHKHNRYYFFVLFTLSATLGVFLSADLYTTFLFFEAMSLASYVWVAQEEDAAAIKASKTYLAVAVIGGLVLLMGLFLLSHLCHTLVIDELYEACRTVENRSLLYVAGACMFVGFGAKAGCFPLHIWLPKAHPVAPAPASALLSGILTKSGVFGVLILAGQIFRHDASFGLVVLWLGTLTMVVGALLALFSIDIKHTLACSSVSQIGFILVGVGCMGILGEENALAVRGAMLHMVNHSLFKLILFQVAGVVVLQLGTRDLNKIQGFGRGKKVFGAAFLSGAVGIAGIPLLSGYVSKTLLHEALVECAHHTHDGMYTALEWVFLVSGGCTLAYMIKLFVVLFIRKPSAEVAACNARLAAQKKGYLSGFGMTALLVPSVLVPVLGVAPNFFMDKIADFGQHFAAGHAPEHAIHYFSWVNLKGSCISIVFGLLIYFLIVRPGTEKKQADGSICYASKYPSWLSLEDLVYAPLLLRVLPFIGAFVSRLADKLIDGVVWVLRKCVLRPVYVEKTVQMHETICNAIGHFLNGVVAVLNMTVARKHPIRKDFVPMVNEARNDLSESVQLVSRSMSYGLLAFCLGLLILLVYLMLSL